MVAPASYSKEQGSRREREIVTEELKKTLPFSFPFTIPVILKSEILHLLVHIFETSAYVPKRMTPGRDTL